VADGRLLALTANVEPRSGQDGPVTPTDVPPPPAEGPRADLQAGLLTTVVLVLLGAPVGLLWAALSPRVDVALRASGPGLVMPENGDFIGADGVFLLIVLAAGTVCGAVAWGLARRTRRGPGPGVVLGLALGGLLAAYVASRTGAQIGREEFLAALDDAGRRGTIQASIRLRATEALVGWPVGALAAFAGLTYSSRR
jgi:hypothetical protein